MAKKAPSKKAPKKPKAETDIVPAPTAETLPEFLLPKKFSYDILAQPVEVMDTVKACMTAAVTRCKNRPSNFKTLAEIRRAMMPVRHFYMRYALGSYGIPQASHLDIIGPPHIGKTSILWWFLGGFMLQGSPCYLQETENKPMTQSRALRFLHSNPALAMNMASKVVVEPVFSLQHSVESLVNWVNSMRGRESSNKRTVNVPIDTPLIAAVDTWGKLMNPAEAAGRYAYADGMSADSKKKFNEVGEGSNMGHAKWAQAFGRVMPEFLARNNVILITIRHQNVKVDMGPNKSFMSPEQGQLYNKTSIGGLSFNQNASVQLILGTGGAAKDRSGNVIGDIVRMRVDKQSYGPKGRIISFILKNDGFHDRDDFIEQAIQFDESMATWMATEKLLGVRVDSKVYSCDRLNLTGVDAPTLCNALAGDSQMEYELGKMLQIDGYVDYVDQIQKALDKAKADQEAAEEAAKEAAKAEKELAKAAKGKAKTSPSAPPEPPQPPSPPEPPAPPTPETVNEASTT